MQGSEETSAAGTCRLTGREREVLDLMAQGKRRKEIAKELDLEVSTVNTYIKQLYAKLAAGNPVEAVNKARRLGLL